MSMGKLRPIERLMMYYLSTDSRLSKPAYFSIIKVAHNHYFPESKTKRADLGLQSVVESPNAMELF